MYTSSATVITTLAVRALKPAVLTRYFCM